MKGEEIIELLMYMTWDELSSHLPFTYDKDRKIDRKFEKDCVVEYAKKMNLLAELYPHLKK